MVKKRIAVLLLLCFAAALAAPAQAAEFTAPLDCKSAVLMEASTGRVLYEKNADAALPPASVTQVMTLLLVKLDDMVPVSEHAASMGGSQVYLKVGEEMTVEEMIKCVVIASANDCAVALAEFVAGSEEAFVTQMNARAEALGMENTHFENTNGLDDTVANHVISARDIAIMSRELIQHELILKYSSIWMDLLRRKRAEDRLDRQGEILHQRHGKTGRHAADCRDYGSADPRCAQQCGKTAPRLRLCQLWRVYR